MGKKKKQESRGPITASQEVDDNVPLLGIFTINGQECQLKPLGERILVRRAVERKTIGGIIIPQTAEEHANVGQVIAIGGPAVKYVRVGDDIMFMPHSGKELKGNLPTEMVKQFEGVRIMVEDDVVAVIRRIVDDEE